MRSLHKFVITAGLLCHLFLIVPLVTSQARAEQAMQNSAASEAQATPSPTPAEQPQQSAAPQASKSGNCHLIITSAPATQHAAKPGTESQPAKATAAAPSTRKTRLPISEETPVTIDADECDKAGDVYTLLRNVKIRFNGYDFGGDTVTYDSASGDVTAKGPCFFRWRTARYAHQRHRGYLQYSFADGKVL